MRRDIRKRNQEKDFNIKIIRYSCIGLAVLILVIFSILMYSKKVNSETQKGTLTSEQITSMLNKTNTEETESTSTEIGKSVEESKNELSSNSTSENKIQNSSKNSETTTKDSAKNTALTTKNITPTTSNTETNKNNIKTNESNNDNVANEAKIELNFEKPVEGDIVRDFAVDNLIYSDTLQEWTTHTGIDIKADKTTVVKAAEAGTVKTIKNDPRYGLTIVVEHSNGFETVYSNLLTSEFVVEGEKVEKGQSLGTVGNTAAFEIADEPHLHFEILKNSAYVNPNNYLK